MDSASIVKRTLEYQKTALDAGFNTMVILQGHAEKMATDLWEKSNVPTETMNAFSSTLGEYKKKRDDMKQMLDDGFDQFSKLFVS